MENHQEQSTLHYYRKQMLRFILTYFSLVIPSILQKPIFTALYCNDTEYFTDWTKVIYHGLSLDFTIAGYLMIIPALLLVVSIWSDSKYLKKAFTIYNGITASLLITIFCLNIILYKFWRFPLDSTPLFYFLSSPKDAISSVSLGFVAIGLLVTFVFIYMTYLFLNKCHSVIAIPHTYNNKKKIISTVILIIFTGLLIIPIRGGITVSTQNTGTAYFSEKMELNHAAVNPAFSLFESIIKENDFAGQYRFMDNQEANRIMNGLINTSDKGMKTILSTKRPDIYIVILESFSDSVMKTGATPQLAKLAKEGIYFENMHANSFRTDRGTLAILSGYPAQPTMSLMKYPKKTNSLPSIGKKLAQSGYGLKYFYGGDADFTNMRSYLVSMDFTDITSDINFPVKDRLSKWGVPDHLVFQRMEEELTEQDKKPRLWVLQTSSSHEPFDVPYHKLNNKVLNAFNYTDDCIGKFITALKKSQKWDNALVIFIPDHLGCYPETIDNFHIYRYEIPMIWTGGAITGPQKIQTYGSQQDIAATLLGQLSIDHSDMKFSKNMLATSVPHFAFFTVPDAWGMAKNGKYVIFNNKNEKVVTKSGNYKSLVPQGKTYLQKLYDDIAAR